jgi:hypothetical protein
VSRLAELEARIDRDAVGEPAVVWRDDYADRMMHHDARMADDDAVDPVIGMNGHALGPARVALYGHGAVTGH